MDLLFERVCLGLFVAAGWLLGITKTVINYPVSLTLQRYVGSQEYRVNDKCRNPNV